MIIYCKDIGDVCIARVGKVGILVHDPLIAHAAPGCFCNECNTYYFKSEIKRFIKDSRDTKLNTILDDNIL